MSDSLLPLHIQTVSGGNAAICVGHPFTERDESEHKQNVIKCGSVVPVKTEKSLSQKPLVVIIHSVNLSTYECIVFFLQYDCYLFIVKTISDACVVLCFSTVQVQIIKCQSKNTYNISLHLSTYVHIKILMTLCT